MESNWQTKKLGELCRIEIGKTPSRSNKKYWDIDKQTHHIWLSIADLLHADRNLIVDSKEYISDAGAAASKIVTEGTLLASFKLTLGRLAFAGTDLYTNEAIAALNIVNEEELDKYFLFYYLNFFDWVGATNGEVKIKGKTLNKAKLRQIEVLYPQLLEEQNRIVNILDEVFEKIEKAKENAEKNLRNSHELFESYLQSIFNASDHRWEYHKFKRNMPIDIRTTYYGR